MARYANVASTIALVFALGTGGAYAAATITGVDIVDGSLHAVDLAPNSVNSAKVGNDTLTGNDIDESTLDITGESTPVLAECDPATATPQKCGQIDFNLRRSARVLVMATAQWYGAQATKTTGVCRIGVDGFTQPRFVSLGQPSPAGFGLPVTDVDHQQSFTLTSIDHEQLPGGPVLAPGAHHANLMCGVTAGDFRVDHVMLSTIALGSLQS